MPGTTSRDPPGIGTSSISPRQPMSIANIMPVRGFEPWVAGRVSVLPMDILSGVRLGIDAGFYLERLLKTQPSKEPLLPALGGFPFGLKGTIEDDILLMRSHNIVPLFVFSGLKPIRQGKPIELEDQAERRSQAWKLYDESQAIQAVETFGKAITLEPSSLYKFVMRILKDYDIEYQVAPYSAWAQLQYLESHEAPFIDAVYGPTEMLFGKTDKLIVGWERGQFKFLNWSQLKTDIGGLSQEQFVDACLLAGSELTEPFPAMDTNINYAFKNALDLMKNYKTVESVVHQLGAKSMPITERNEYIDLHHRAVMAIRHHIILTEQGEVEPMDWAQAPGDIHDFMGQHLPEEVYFYLSRGVISAEVLDMLVSRQITEVAPLDNYSTDTTDYKRVIEGLQLLRTQVLALLSQPLHRFWQAQSVNITFWFDRANPRQMSTKDILPTPYETVTSWNVKEAVFRPRLKETTASLTFAMTSLTDPDFVAKTVSTKDEDKLLDTTDEIIMNTFWRTLQIRGYINQSDHKLTAWGKVLQAALASLRPEDDLEEACFLGIELLRERALKPDTRGNAALVSRVASLAKLRHHAIGYTGPLSRELLQFNSIVRPYARTHRHLMEMVLLSLLLNRDANRENRNDWEALGLSIPFWEEVNAGMGIAVKTYLDELANQPDPTAVETRYRAHAEDLPRMLSQTIDVTANLVRAFRLWDAIIIGIKAVSKDNHIQDAAKFFEIDEWLSKRRPAVLDQ